MNNQRQVIEIEIPTSRRLLKSVIIAIVTAAAVLVTVILPAERAIDPTGIGRLLGLTEMGEIKNRQLKESMQETSDILSKAAQLEALIAIQKRLDAIEAKLPDMKTPRNASP